MDQRGTWRSILKPNLGEDTIKRGEGEKIGYGYNRLCLQNIPS